MDVSDAMFRLRSYYVGVLDSVQDLNIDLDILVSNAYNDEVIAHGTHMIDAEFEAASIRLRDVVDAYVVRAHTIRSLHFATICEIGYIIDDLASIHRRASAIRRLYAIRASSSTLRPLPSYRYRTRRVRTGTPFVDIVDETPRNARVL